MLLLVALRSTTPYPARCSLLIYWHPIVGGAGETVSDSYIRILYPKVSRKLLAYLPTVFRNQGIVRVFHPREAPQRAAAARGLALSASRVARRWEGREESRRAEEHAELRGRMSPHG